MFEDRTSPARRPRRSQEALTPADRSPRKSTPHLEGREPDAQRIVAAQAEQLRQLAAEITTAEQRERQRIVRLLHDHVQPLLIGAQMGLRLAVGTPRDPAAADDAAAIENAAALLDEGLAELRTLAAELTPPILDERGLVSGLEWLANQTLHRHRLTVRVALDPAAEPRDPALRAFAYAAARELLLNAVKHAGVSAATLSLERDGGHLTLAVEDAGRGFDPELATQPGRDPSCLGLFALRARASRLGGGLTVRSAPGQGAHVAVRLPVDWSGLLAPAEPLPADRRHEAGRDGGGRDEGGCPRK